MDENIQILEREYCPPLDPALVYAICSDFSGPDGLQQARTILDGIKQTASEEQNTDFDPSGSSGSGSQSSPSKNSNSSEVESNAESLLSQTTITDCTSLSNDLSCLSLDTAPEGAGGGYFKDAEQLDKQTKEQILQETFPNLRSELVAFTLKKCGNDFTKATDELLNHVYFEDSRASPDEETAVAKGIDAFFEEHTLPTRGRKGKGKKQYKKFGSSSTSSSSPELAAVPASNVWHNSSQDIEFISSRVHVSPKTIASEYHKNGASISATILALVEADLKSHEGSNGPSNDSELMTHAVDLVVHFEAAINVEQAVALLRLTDASTGPGVANPSAYALARALLKQPTTGLSSPVSVKVIPSYTPIDLSETVQTEQPTSSLPPSARSPTTTSLAAARSKAFTQASQYYRQGKSTPLMKAAAGYYAQQGRDLNAALRASSAADADVIVASQSTSTQLDLHGVSVENATRIASQKVRAWWDGLGEARIPGGGRRGAGDGYRIVTGLGRHSEGGRGKIGPAVARVLVREGWKLEVGSGVLTVMGMARRK